MGKEFGLYLAVPFDPIQLAASSSEELGLWKAALQNAVRVAQQSLRGFMLKQSLTVQGQQRLKYFILHEDALTYHKDSVHLSTVQGCLYFHEGTLATYHDDELRIVISDSASNQR